MVAAALVGLGWWGEVLLDAVAVRPGPLRFVAAVTKDPARESHRARRHGVPVYEDLSEVLARDDVQAVVLATPHSLHVEQVVTAAQAGRHVFTEKPLALRLDEARRAVDACERAGVVLGIGTDKRFLGAVVAWRELAESGELGDLLHLEGNYSNPNNARGVSGSWRASPDEAPGGGLSGPGLHVLDGMVALAGPVAEADVRILRREAPFDAVAGRLLFASGATGVLATVRGVPDYFRLSAFGSAGWAEVRGFGTLTYCLGDGTVVHHDHDPQLAASQLLGRFADAVEGRAPFPVTPASMLDTVAAFEACVDSLQRSGPEELAA